MVNYYGKHKILKKIYYKESINSENTVSDLTVSTELKETTMFWEHGSGEELRFQLKLKI